MKIHHYGDLGSIQWPENDADVWLKQVILSLTKDNIDKYIKNIKTDIKILEVEGCFIPLTINETEYANSRVCSIFSHLLAVEKEAKKHLKQPLQFLLRPLFTLAKVLFKIAKMNKIVAINNLPFTTILHESLSKNQVQKIVGFLTRQFPKYVFVFRSINSYTDGELINSLKNNNFKFAISRNIYLFDPSKYYGLSQTKKKAIRRDDKLLMKNNMRVLTHEDFNPENDAKEMTRLYNRLNLEKHSGANHFTEDFFRQSIKYKTLTFIGILYNNTLVGFTGFYQKKSVFTEPVIGYDISLPRELGIYRILSSIIINESLRNKKILHLSAGAGEFKMHRGALPEIEYFSFYCEHLNPFRRAIIKFMGWIATKISMMFFREHHY